MGCDIHTWVQVQRDDGVWRTVDKAKIKELVRASIEDPEDRRFGPSELFNVRSYGWFGFLANVRNYSRVPTIADPRGLPEDISNETIGHTFRVEYVDPIRESYVEGDRHSWSWLTAAELMNFSYDQMIWDMRVMREGNGAALARENEGTRQSLREFLGPLFFEHIKIMASLAEDPSRVRVVFSFDN